MYNKNGYKFFGVKTASSAVLLSIVVSIALLTLFDEIYSIEKPLFFWIIISLLAIICNAVVILLLLNIRREMMSDERYIFAANSMYVEAFSETFSLFAEIAGFILVICEFVNHSFIHDFSALASILSALQYITVPTSILALSLVTYRLHTHLKIKIDVPSIQKKDRVGE